jgi:hypothetical protein
MDTEQLNSAWSFLPHLHNIAPYSPKYSPFPSEKLAADVKSYTFCKMLYNLVRTIAEFGLIRTLI